jgi:predicted aspartyl protease
VADTGSALTMIFNSAVSRFGLELDDFDRQRVRSTGIGGGAGEIHATRLNAFKIGEAIVKDMPIMVGGDVQSSDGKVSGLLGEDFFQGYDVEFDLQNRRINLFRPRNCDDHPLAYWTDDYGVVAFDTGRRSPMILLSAKINQQSFTAQLDSGAPISFMTEETAQRVGVTGETPGVEPAERLTGLGHNSVAAWIAPFQSFAIADETVNHIKMRVANVVNLHWQRYATLQTLNKVDDKAIGYQAVSVLNSDMVLGEDFLTAHRVLISHSQHKIYFSYIGGPIFKPHRMPPAAPTAPAEK